MSKSILKAQTALGTTAAGGLQLPGNITGAVLSTCTSAAFGVTLGNNDCNQLALAPRSYFIQNNGVSAATLFAPTTNGTCLINGQASIQVYPGQTVMIQFSSSTVGYVISTSGGGSVVSAAVPSLTCLVGGGQPTVAGNAAACISVSQQYVIVGTSGVTGMGTGVPDSVALPDSANLGQSYIVCNTTANAIAVWVGSLNASTINGSTAPLFLAAFSSGEFIALKNTAGVISWAGHALGSGKKPLIGPITGACTLTASFSGCIVTFASGAGNYNITLPAVGSATSGWQCDFIQQATAGTNSVTLLAQSAVNSGTITCLSTGTATLASHTSVTFASTSVVGDSCTIWGDGTLWYTRAASKITTGSIASAA